MNNSYLKVDEIQVRARHGPLMYVIYVCTPTPQSSALRIVARVPWPPSPTHQSGGTSNHSVHSTLKLKQRVINKYMFPLKVGVSATPSVYAEGALLGRLADDVMEGQVLFLDCVSSPGGFSATGLCLTHTRKEPLTKVEKQGFNGRKRSPLGKH